MAELSRRAALMTGLMAALSAGLARAEGARTRLVGQFAQGGLVIGRAEPGARARLGGADLRVSPEGWFAFGFGRDHADAAQLALTYADGTPETLPLSVAPRAWRIQRIDGLPDAMVTPPEDVLARIDRENALIAAARSRDTAETWFSSVLRWPVKGPVTGVFGSQRILNGEPKRPHFGVDVAAPTGTPIAAPLDAIVSLAEPDLYFTGGTMILDHGHGISTSYLHLSRLDARVGDRLSAGDVIGAVGATGRATGPHLCWRLNWFQERLDPELAAGPMPAG